MSTEKKRRLRVVPPPEPPEPPPKPKPKRRPKVTRGGVTKHPSGLTVRDADLSRSRRFRWAWDQRTLIGYLNLLIGEEGIGKGTLAAWQGARITRGELRGDLHGEPHKVAFIGDEDNWDNIWVPRLYAAGADLKMAKYIEAGRNGGVLNVQRDADALREFVKAENVAWVYFDQLLDNLGNADNWKDKDIRDALAPLRRVAQDLNIAVVLSMHPNKSRRGSFRDRVSGTPAFNALSRSSMLLAKHPDEPGRIVAVRAKGNYSSEPPAFEFRIEGFDVMGAESITVPRTAEIRETGLRADDVLDAESSRRQEHSNAGRARALLSEIMADGRPQPAGEVLETMKAHGFSPRDAQRARTDLKLDTWKAPEFGGGWVWGHKPVDVIQAKPAEEEAEEE